MPCALAAHPGVEALCFQCSATMWDSQLPHWTVRMETTTVSSPLNELIPSAISFPCYKCQLRYVCGCVCVRACACVRAHVEAVTNAHNNLRGSKLPHGGQLPSNINSPSPLRKRHFNGERRPSEGFLRASSLLPTLHIFLIHLKCQQNQGTMHNSWQCLPLKHRAARWGSPGGSEWLRCGEEENA